MKTFLMILAALLLTFGGLYGQVYFGIYVEDLDFPKAHELGYKYLHGILITGVVNGSPADQAGLQAKDIMMEIDGAPVTNNAEFDRLRAELKPGQEISLRVWRGEEITDFNLVLRPRSQEGTVITKEIRKEVYKGDGQPKSARKKDIGSGGGGWVPYWFTFPVNDVNELIDKIGDPLPLPKGFTPNAISSKGVFMHGGAGKGHIGNGFFIGGVGAGYEYKESDPTTNSSIKYEVSFGGATLDKRFLISRNFAASLGVMLGGGGHVVKYSQTQTGFTWPQVFTDNNFTATLKREYFVVQPRAELMLRLVDWLSLRAEVGYVYGVPTYSGWKVDSGTGDDFAITGSPNTPFHGLSFSVGPWIGF